MNNDELEKQLAALTKVVADQQIMLIRFMAHQQAHLALLRDVLVQLGRDRTKLHQQIEAAYDSARQLYGEQLQMFQETGDAQAFVKAISFPDSTQSN